MTPPFPQKLATVISKVSNKLFALHSVTETSEKFFSAAFNASFRLKSKASFNVILRLSSNSSFVRSWKVHICFGRMGAWIANRSFNWAGVYPPSEGLPCSPCPMECLPPWDGVGFSIPLGLLQFYSIGVFSLLLNFHDFNAFCDFYDFYDFNGFNIFNNLSVPISTVVSLCDQRGSETRSHPGCLSRMLSRLCGLTFEV